MASSIVNIIQDLSDFETARRMHIAAITVFVYEWMQTLPHELQYIWTKPWSLIKLVFIFNRYLLPLDLLFTYYAWSGEAKWLKQTGCEIFLAVDNYVLVVIFAGLHYIVSMRTWALWGKGFWVGILIWGTAIIDTGVTLWITRLVIVAVSKEKFLFPGLCSPFPLVIPDFLWLIWLPSVIFELIIFILTAIKAVQHFKQQVNNDWLNLFYRDGFIYFLFIVTNSVINMFVVGLGRPGQVLLYKYFSASICQIAGARLVLDLLRKPTSSNRENMTTVATEQQQLTTVPPPYDVTFGAASFFAMSPNKTDRWSMDRSSIAKHTYPGDDEKWWPTGSMTSRPW